MRARPQWWETSGRNEKETKHICFRNYVHLVLVRTPSCLELENQSGMRVFLVLAPLSSQLLEVGCTFFFFFYFRASLYTYLACMLSMLSPFFSFGLISVFFFSGTMLLTSDVMHIIVPVFVFYLLLLLLRYATMGVYIFFFFFAIYH